MPAARSPSMKRQSGAYASLATNGSTIARQSGGSASNCDSSVSADAPPCTAGGADGV
ncbi:hypothetical protein DP49_5763 [Burkholderia pseudomallei]|nr:hypothetical protein DP49_5763 [Burkholderia pseudomallei]